MAKPRVPWNIRLAKKKVVIPAPIKKQVETNAKYLIENLLKPIHIVPPAKGEKFNYISDITGKWFRGYFYFISTYTCPDPNNIHSTFESKFARMEYIGNGTFALYSITSTGKWIGMYDALSVDDSMKAVQDDLCFAP